MSLNEEVEALRSVPLFAKIEPSKLKLLAFTSERLTFPAGGELFHEGDQGDSAYIILDGQAEIIIDTPNGELAVAKVGKNDLIGEIDAQAGISMFQLHGSETSERVADIKSRTGKRVIKAIKV